MNYLYTPVTQPLRIHVNFEVISWPDFSQVLQFLMSPCPFLVRAGVQGLAETAYPQLRKL